MKAKLLLAFLMLTITVGCILATAVSVAAKFNDVPDSAWYTADVLKANELGIMNGTSATTFAPLKNLTRAEYVAILFRLSNAEESIAFSFTDVPDGAWYAKYVGWAESTGIITGYGNAYTFGGDKLITREQLMLMTSRYMDYKGIAFPDSDDAVYDETECGGTIYLVYAGLFPNKIIYAYSGSKYEADFEVKS